VFVGAAAVVGTTVAIAEEKVRAARKRIEQNSKAAEDAELARQKLVAQMHLLQAKDAKLVRLLVKLGCAWSAYTNPDLLERYCQCAEDVS
jgi:hypothetical protein